jgi:hypothetical protein
LASVDQNDTHVGELDESPGRDGQKTHYRQSVMRRLYEILRDPGEDQEVRAGAYPNLLAVVRCRNLIG